MWCTCSDFTMHRLPCKHILSAVGENFLKLPQGYRSCIEFNSSVQLLNNPDVVSVVKFTQDRAPVASPDCVDLTHELTAAAELEQKDEEVVSNQPENLEELQTSAQVPTIRVNIS